MGVRSGGMIHLWECHKAKNVPSFPVGSCALCKPHYIIYQDSKLYLLEDPL